MPAKTALPLAPMPVASPTVPVEGEAISAQNIDLVALINRLGKGMVDDLAYTPDGKTLAVVTAQGVYLYDAQTLTEKEAYPYTGDISPVQVAYNRQGDLLALGTQPDLEACWLVLWRFFDGRWQQVGQVEAYIECLAATLAPDGEYLVGANYNTLQAAVWRTSDLEQVGAFPLDYTGDIYSILVQLAFSGVDTLAIEAGDHVSLYDLVTGKLLQHLEGPGLTALHRLAISQDGSVVAARDSVAQKIQIWKLHDQMGITLDDTYEDWLAGAPLLLSPSGDLLALGHNNPSGGQPGAWVDVWQSSDGVSLSRVTNPEWLYGPEMKFHPGGSTLVTWQEGVDFWQARDVSHLASLPGYERYDGILSPDGALMAQQDDGRIQLIRLSDGQVVQTLAAAGEAGPGRLVFSPDSSLIASIHVPGTVEIWNVTDRSLEKSYEMQGDGNNFIIISGGNYMVNVDAGGKSVSLISIWDGEILKSYPNPIIDEFGGLLAAILPDGKLFALGATNSAIEVWQQGADEPLYRLSADFEWTALCFSPDGKSLVTSADAIQVWNADDGKLRFIPSGELTSYGNALFSPDGAQIVTQEPGVLHLWDMRDGTRLLSIDALPPAAFSPDGTLLVSSGAGTMGFWQLNDGALLRSLEASTSPAAFSTDGRTLIGIGDGIVETWGLSAP